MGNKRNNNASYYGLWNKSSDRLIIYPYKSAVAQAIGISVYLLTKHMKHSSIYDTEKCIIWSGIHFPIMNRGFRLKPRYKRF